MTKIVKFDMIEIDGEWREYPNGIFTDEGEVYDNKDEDLPYINLALDENVKINVNGEEIYGTTEHVITKLAFAFYDIEDIINN